MSFKCPKALDELQPCESNWYCDGCKQMVHDFRGLSEEQILDTFKQSGQRLCGIYDADRMRVLPQKPKWFRSVSAALMALSVALLNSCGFGQKDKNISSITVQKNIQTVTMGLPLFTPKADTPKHYHKIKKIKVKFPPPVLVGDIAIEAPTDTSSTNNYFVGAIETSPTFPGGETALMKYLQEHIKNNGEFKGRAFAQFTVEEDGSLSSIKILRSAGEILDKQIVDAIRNMPKWKPGMQSGKICKTQYIIPINLTLPD